MQGRARRALLQPVSGAPQAYPSLCSVRRLAQLSIPGSAATLLGGFQLLIEVVAGNHLRVIVHRSLWGWRWRALGAVPPLEVAQDSLDDRGAVDQADDLERAAATRANEWVRFVHLLDEPSPGAPQPAGELIGASGSLPGAAPAR
ncbi:MAG: hypothetical protein ABSC02_15170 [Acidobacteriota bacterium]